MLNRFLNLQSSTNQNQPPTIRQELNRQHQSPHQVIANATVATAVVASSTHAKTADDFLTQINALLVKKANEQEVIRLLNQALAIQQSGKAYFYCAYSKYSLGDKEGAIPDYSQSIAINPHNAKAYNNRGVAKAKLEDYQRAIADYNVAIAINPLFEEAYSNRGNAKFDLGAKRSACCNNKQAVSLGNKSTAQWLQSKDGAWYCDMP